MSASLWHTPLDDFQKKVAAPQPAPAAVATACVIAALGVSLLIKALRITGKREDLLPTIERLLAEIRVAADADVEAVTAYVQSRETSELRDVPPKALRAVRETLDLCVQAEPSISGLIAADARAAIALVRGAADAIEACITANQAGSGAKV